MNAESELEAVGHGVGRGGHGHAQRHRLDRSGALADAGVARRALLRADPAGRAQHGAGPGRLLAGDARSRPRRLAHAGARADGRARGGRAHAARVPPRAAVAQPGAALRRLLPRAHVDVGGGGDARLRAARRSTTGRSTGPPVAPAARGCVAARHDQAQRAAAATTSPSTTAECARATEEMLARHRAAGRDRLHRRRRRGRGRVRHPGEVRAGRRRPAACRRRAGRVRPPDHAVAVPDRGRRRAPPTARHGRRGVREQPGPDGRRRAPRGRRRGRRCEFIGRLSLDGSGFGIAPDLDGAYLRDRIQELLDERVGP